MNIYIILLFLIVMILFAQKKENMCSCDNELDYYGQLKCLDWEETMRRRGGNRTARYMES